MDWSGVAARARDLLPWPVSSLSISTGDVRTLVPDVFPAYARILHPAFREAHGHETVVRWAEVADATGRQIRPSTHIAEVAGLAWFTDVTTHWDREPSVGTLDPPLCGILADLLSTSLSAGSDTECTYALWEGRGDIPRQLRAAGCYTTIGADRFIVLRETLDLARRWHDFPPTQALDTPNAWWPRSAEWFVSTNVDQISTYIGGSVDLVDTIIESGDIEALRVLATTPITWPPRTDRVR